MSLYDPIAVEYDAHAQTGVYNRLYDEPTVLELLGDIAGLRVLDAGCGSGLYAERLLERGAKVVGVDASAELLALAAGRLGTRAQLHHQDLSQPLTWAGNASFDRVVMALVLHYLDDPVPALREMHRVLADDGHLVISTHHPALDWQRLGGSYFTDEMYQEQWSSGWTMRYPRRPLHSMTDEFAEAGFLIDRIAEHRPVPEMAEADPRNYEKLSTTPAFIAFRLIKRPADGR